MGLILDGKTFGKDEMMVTLGVMIEGRKILLGFIETGRSFGLEESGFMGLIPPVCERLSEQVYTLK